MEILFFMLPISIATLFIAIAYFFWAVRSGQYDDLDRHARDILLDDAIEQAKRGKKID